MRLCPGDRVKIIKPGHVANGDAGVVLGFGQLEYVNSPLFDPRDVGVPIVYVAGSDGHFDGKVWPIFVLRLQHVELIAQGDITTSRRLVEDIIDMAEARGCPLRGIYDWAGPYKPKNKITG